MFSRLSSGSRTAVQLGFVVLVCAIALGLVLWMGAGKPANKSRNVTFRVDASGGVAFITLEAGTVKIPKLTTVTAPWIKTIQVNRGTTVFLTASNPTQTGKLTCSITLDTEAWKNESTDAPKDGVACAGIVP